MHSLTAFRKSLLSEMPDNPLGIVASPVRGYVWPTFRCSIGCAHCNFSSLPRLERGQRETIDPVQIADWLAEAKARTLILCGGGEPLDEPEFCERAIRRAGEHSLNVGIYTSGVSLSRPQAVEDYVETWRAALGSSHAWFALRLSIDTFHAERIGIAHLAEWITVVRRLAPDWRLSLRGLSLDGDMSVSELAGELGADLVPQGKRSVRLNLKDGTGITVERTGFVLDGRASLEQLARRGLRIPAAQGESLASWTRLVGRTRRIGRPLSRRLPVAKTRVDLEIHSDSAVHVLESQAFDLRLSSRSHTWREMTDLYYRDPLIHAVVIAGLALVAQCLREAIESGVADRGTVPFSIEQIRDPALLDRVTAMVVMALETVVPYPSEVSARAAAFLCA